MLSATTDLAIEAIKQRGFLSGLADCHVPGLFSLVISNRVDESVGMKRIFYAGRDCRIIREFCKPVEDGIEFSVLPHNHLQDITLYSLFGHALNWDMEVSDDGPSTEWQFQSAILNGEFGLSRVRSVRVNVIERPISREGIYLPAAQVHTVTAEPDTAWLVDEGRLSGEWTTRCYSIQPTVDLCADGLYRKLSEAELRELAEAILAKSSPTAPAVGHGRTS